MTYNANYTFSTGITDGEMNNKMIVSVMGVKKKYISLFPKAIFVLYIYNIFSQEFRRVAQSCAIPIVVILCDKPTACNTFLKNMFFVF